MKWMGRARLNNYDKARNRLQDALLWTQILAERKDFDWYNFEHRAALKHGMYLASCLIAEMDSAHDQTVDGIRQMVRKLMRKERENESR